MKPFCSLASHRQNSLLYTLMVVGMVILCPCAVLEASASFVEVMRWDTTHHQWVFVKGDLVTPEPSPENQSPSVILNNVWTWDSPSVGPLFADVKFLYSSPTPISTLNDHNGNVTVALESTEDLSDFLFSSIDSTSGAVQPDLSLSRNINGTLSLSGNTNGTVNATANLTIEGPLTPVSPVPLLGTVWMFGTGLAGLVGFLFYRGSHLPPSC